MLCLWVYRLADLPARLSFLYLRCTNPSTAKPVNLIALARRYTIRLLPAFILAQQLISHIVGQLTKQAVHHYSYWRVFSLSRKASPVLPLLGNPADDPKFPPLSLSCISLVWRDWISPAKRTACAASASFASDDCDLMVVVCQIIFFQLLYGDTHLFACQKVSKKTKFFNHLL